MDALRFQHEEQRRQQRKAFQELEEECRSAQAERDALQDRFVGEWRRFCGRADQHVASLSAVMSKGRAMRGRRPHASHRVVTPVGRVLTSQERKLASRRREISDPYMSNVCAKLGEIHLPCVPRPPASDTKARTAYDMRALLAAMNSTRKAAVLAGVNDRIVRAQRYRSVYDKITREIRARKRLKRQSIISKLRAAVQLNEITGSFKAFTGFRRMERQNSGAPSANCSLDEVREGTKIIWEACTEKLNIYATRDGHGVSMRSTVEVEVLRYLQTESSKAPRMDSNGKAYTKTPATFENRTPGKKEDPDASSDAPMDPCPYPERWQDSFVVKFTWDARNISKKMNQTEGMCLIIPQGPEGQLYCQSALRIRTVIVYTGKDSKEMAQENLMRVFKELKDLLVHGLRYSAKHDTFLNQVLPDGTKAPLESGDRDVRVEVVVPADMAAHVGLLGHGGIRDSKKQFCTNCTCCMSERHTPLCLIRLDADMSVASLAAAHDMHPDLFLAMNTGRDPSGMFPGQELSERILSHKTVPLPRGRGPPPTAAAPAAAGVPPAPDQPVTAAEPGRAADGTGGASRGQHDQRYGTSKRRRKAPVKPSAPSASQPLPSAPPTLVSGGEPNEQPEPEPAMDWNAAIGEDESCLTGNASANKDTVVRAGSIVRVVGTFKVDRPSEFLHDFLNLDPHR